MHLLLLLAYTGPDTTETTDSVAADTEPAPPLVPIVVEDAWVLGLAGLWLGPADPTPQGRIDTFPLDFQVQDDGSVRATTAAGTDGDTIDLRFLTDGDGGWTLHESATLSGVTQAYTTHPVAIDGAAITWVTLDAPDFLAIRVAPASDTLDITVTLRGAEHVVFDLDRMR